MGTTSAVVVNATLAPVSDAVRISEAAEANLTEPALNQIIATVAGTSWALG